MVLRIGDVISGDPDKLFAYHTNVSVVLKNRYTGCFFRIFQFLLLFYITFIVKLIRLFNKSMSLSFTFLGIFTFRFPI